MKNPSRAEPAYLSGIVAGLAVVTVSVFCLAALIAYQSISAGAMV